MSNPSGSDDAFDEAEARGFLAQPEPWHLKPWRTSIIPGIDQIKARLDEIDHERGQLRVLLAYEERRAHKAEVAREKAGR